MNEINADEFLNFGAMPTATPQNTGSANPFEQFNPGDGTDQKGNADTIAAKADDPTGYANTMVTANGAGAGQQTWMQDQYLNGGLDKATPTAKQNTPLNDPFTNEYNNMSWEESQRLARLADAYNNSHHWTPGKLGTSAESMQMPQFVKNDQIQTQETRRNDLAQQGLAQQQSYTLGRNNAALAYPLELTKMFDQTSNQAYAAMLELNRNYGDYVRQSAFNMEFKGEYEQALQKGMMWYAENMKQYQGGKVGAILWDVFEKNPQYAQYIGQQIAQGILPTQGQALAQQVVNDMLEKGRIANLTPAEQSALVNQINQMVGVYTGSQDIYFGYYGMGQSMMAPFGGYSSKN